MTTQPGITPLPGFLHARRVAVIGGSANPADPASFPARMTRSVAASNLERMWVVESSADGDGELESIARLHGEDVELAVIVTGRRRLASTLRALSAAGVPRALSVAGGLSISERSELAALTRELGIRLWGPNCVGFIDNTVGARIFASDYVPAVFADQPNLMVVAQSGSVSRDIAAMLPRHGVGVSQLITTGDEIDIGLEDAMEHLAATRCAAGMIAFVETIRRPARFMSAAAGLTRAAVPVVVVKVGRSSRARDAAMSHTGAIVGDWEEFQAAALAAGIIACDGLQAAVDVAALLALSGPKRWGRRLAVFTNSGGAAELASDFIESTRSAVAGFAPATAAALAPTQVGGAVATNPFDSSAARGGSATVNLFLAAIQEDPGVDAVVIHKTGTIAAERIVMACTAISAARKPVAACWAAIPAHLAQQLQRAAVAVFEDHARTYQAIARASEWARSVDRLTRHREAWHDIRALTAGRRLGYGHSMQLLSQWGIATPPRLTIVTPDQLRADDLAAHSVRFPVVAKIASSEEHKRAAGQLIIGIRDIGELQAWLDDRPGQEVVIEEYVFGSAELFVSVKESAFGQLTTIGVGGSAVEQLAATATFRGPLRVEDVCDWLGGTKVGAVLDALSPDHAGGLPRRVAEFTSQLAGLARQGGLTEIEINPLSFADGRLIALDAKIVTGAEPG